MEKNSKTWGITSMICGILGVLSIFMPYFGLPFAIMALIFAYKQIKIQPEGFAVAGKVLGIIGIVINGIMLFIVVLVLLIASAFA